ncbi:transglutaminase-like enzymes, cysteine protease YebA [Bacillus freudenreichii]|nr:transglutaminase-like enzymes, cysteine protease YebA [Bacillus freudenreichii]
MNNSRGFAFILYTLGFVLLWEWLLPLEQITQTSEVHYFIIFVVVSLCLNFFQAPWFVTWPVKGAFILYALFSIFGGALGPFPWFVHFFNEMKANVTLVLSRDLLDLTPPFRSLLFFLLLWQITYLLRYWLTIKRKIFVFYLMTIFYITLLDTFTEYKADRAIVRIVIIGFTLLGLLFFKRMLEKERMSGQYQLMLRWMVPLAAMVSFGVVIGYLSPKAAPVWPDPVPFIESKAENMRGTGVSKIGYGIDDSQLGGPFINDDRVVFTVTTPARQYWKIETKDLYTGKGWVTSNQREAPTAIQYGDNYPIDLSPSDHPIREARFEFDIVYPHVVRPYGFLSIEKDEDKTGFLRYDLNLDKISPFTINGNEARLNKYTIYYRPASYSMKELRGINELPKEEDYFGLKKQYTQLPETLPARVHDLARELTDEYDNWYDKARAIEKHFQSGKFSYDQTRVAIPAKDEDYVDQFLFDTKRGYCDNFSTSMVVMLRSLDIPARWVKGYAPGKYKGSAGDDYRIYEVTNNEAHSWVEVLFPTMGWVPFEPTKGFNNPTTIINDEQTGSASVSASNEESTESVESQPDEKGSEAEETGKDVIVKEVKVAKFFYKYWGAIGLAIIVISLTAAGLLLSRDRWVPGYLIWKFKKRQEEAAFAEAYETLLKRFDSFGLKRKPGQTLRSYAADIDRHFDSEEMSQLTERYEKLVYGGGKASGEWEYSRELWENLIKKTRN